MPQIMLLLSALLQLAPLIGHSGTGINVIVQAIEGVLGDPKAIEGDVGAIIGDILKILVNSSAISTAQRAKIQEVLTALESGVSSLEATPVQTAEGDAEVSGAASG